ncbi:MAG: CBS domain-containing protein [Bacteroidota bacterium]
MKTLVSEILKRKGDIVYTVNENEVMFNAVKKMHDKKIGSLLVVNDGGNLVGIITERDILYKCYQTASSMITTTTTVKERMTLSENLIVGKPDQTASDLMAVMTDKKIRHIPILDNDAIVGVVSIGDVLKGVVDAREAEANMLREHIKNPFGVHIYK